MKGYLVILALTALLFLSACGNSTTTYFESPDIKDDFCGVHINYQYCKCAFHNEFCDNIGMDKRSANTHVRAEYNKWVLELLDDFLMNCELTGGIPGDDYCEYCDEGYVKQDDQCVSIEEEDEEEEEKGEFKPDGPLNDDCSINEAEFNADWRKYSDIDEVIPYNERSYEAKNAVSAYDAMIENMIEAFELERDIEIENQMQVELEAYKSALVMNMKTNLLKAFWRLSWVTYTTIKSGSGLGDSYSQVLTSGGSVETIGAGLKVVQGLVPANSQLAINTSTTGGKAKSVGANTALEAVDSLGDPTKIATELFKSATMATMPSADISPEEIEILKQQHIANGVVDKALADSRAANQAREARLAVLETEIAKHQQEIAKWEAEEKERVKRSLEASCLELKKKYNK